MADAYTKDEDKRFTLRMDRTLFDRLEALAKKDRRAVGREIEYIVEQYLDENEGK